MVHKSLSLPKWQRRPGSKEVHHPISVLHRSVPLRTDVQHRPRHTSNSCRTIVSISFSILGRFCFLFVLEKQAKNKCHESKRNTKPNFNDLSDSQVCPSLFLVSLVAPEPLGHRHLAHLINSPRRGCAEMQKHRRQKACHLVPTSEGLEAKQSRTSTSWHRMCFAPHGGPFPVC